MKNSWILALPLLAACAGSTAVPATPSASETTATAAKPSEIPAPGSAGAEPPQAVALLPQAPAPYKPDFDALDPLAVNGALEESTVPKVVLTPAKEVRRKSRSDLDGALTAAKTAKTVDDAATVITKRVGKPTYVESEGQRRVWVAADGSKCHRLVLENDGSLELEVAASNEWKSLSMSAKQKLCSGEIKKGRTAE